MPAFSRFEELDAWQEARSLTRRIYQLTSQRPLCTDFSLRDQLRKSCLSLMSNIAEGFERDGTAEFHQFLSIAKGSCGEIRAQLFVALDARYIDEHTFDQLKNHAEKISRIIYGLMLHLRESDRPGLKYE